MGLGVRDVAVLFLACLVFFISVYTDSFGSNYSLTNSSIDLHIEPAFYQTIDAKGESFANGQTPLPNEVVPPPLITDIDGDGRNEIVLVTREPALKILRLRDEVIDPTTPITTDVKNFEVVAEVGLLASLMIKAGRQPVALASGYVKPYSKFRNRKQIIVVVTEGWNILVFNYQLKLLWSRSIESADLSQSYLSEVSILIDPHPMRLNDTGVVIVGGRMSPKRDLTHLQTHHSDPSATDESATHGTSQFMPHESHSTRILKPGDAVVDTIEDNDQETESLMKDNLHFDRQESHFSYYAFDGRTGSNRWRHDSTSFVEEDIASGLLRPQHEVHIGEVDWRQFRTSILHSLPHSWNGDRMDTWLDLKHFEKTRKGHDRQAVKRKRKIKSNFFIQDAFNLRPHSDTEHVENPNAIVSHVRDGIEILHFYSGRPLCRLTMNKGSVHVDMNGDGVIDHIEPVGGMHLPHIKQRSQHGIELPKCLAIVHSGVPSSRQLFNASICQDSWPANIFGTFSALQPQEASGVGGMGGSSGVLTAEGHTAEEQGAFTRLGHLFGSTKASQLNNDQLAVAHPIVIQDPTTFGKSIKRRRWHAVFFLNTGLVTAVNHDGKRSWKTLTKSNWLTSPRGSDGELSAAQYAFRPSVVPYALRADTKADHILTVGEDSVTILSLGGSVRSSVLLRDVSIAHPIVGDLNNDGINDIIVIAPKGYYAYTITRRIGVQLFNVLLFILVIILGIVLTFKIATQATLMNTQRLQAQTGMYSSNAATRPNQRIKTTFTSTFQSNLTPSSNFKATVKPD